APSDSTPYFRVERTRPDQTAELLTILLSPRPIEGIPIQANRLKLTNAQLTVWEKQWKTNTYRLEAPAEAGKAYTAAEKQAGEEKKSLEKGDPLPQPMFQVEPKPGAPMMIHLPLQISK